MHINLTDGFLGTRASFMLDFVVLAMLGVVPLVALSVYVVMYRRRYALHKRMQLAIGAVLLVTVACFEVDMRINGWKERAIGSPYYGEGGGTNWVHVALMVHLVFSVSTAVLWVLVMARALANFSSPPAPGPHSTWHRRVGMLAALDLVATAITGWIFYWLAFVA